MGGLGDMVDVLDAGIDEGRYHDAADQTDSVGKPFAPVPDLGRSKKLLQCRD